MLLRVGEFLLERGQALLRGLVFLLLEVELLHRHAVDVATEHVDLLR